MSFTANITRLMLISLLATGCGGGGGGRSGSVPGSPTELTANAGDASISIGWSAPADTGGSAISGYSVQIVPEVTQADIVVSGTRALISNIANGTDYQISVAANNAVGSGPYSAVVTARARAADSADYEPITIIGDPGSPSGIYDPSLLRSSAGDLWLSYSSVNYYINGSGDLVQDVGIRLANSVDNGSTYYYTTTIASPTDATVTDSDPAMSACGAVTCSGRWVFETSWLVEDSGDPDPDRRFKLFAHQYFINPGSSGSATLYHLGAVVMWTARAPDSSWSAPTVLLGWPLTTPDLSPMMDISGLSADTANCLLVAEGGVTLNAGRLDMAFSCPYLDVSSNTIVQKIVLLRSSDHGRSFQYVATLLTPDDAPDGVDYFSAPAMIANDDAAQILLVTPVVNGFYAGSMVFPFAAKSGNKLFASGTGPSALLYVPVQAPGHIGGASTYARGTGDLGILQSDATIGASLLDTQFKIVSTGAMIE